MAKQPYNPHLRAALLEIVETQLRDGEPAETRVTLERLIGEGYSREQAVQFIACTVSTEIFDVLKSRQPYQQARDVAALRRLPRMPWESEEEKPKE
jgi:hypothetical protein